MKKNGHISNHLLSECIGHYADVAADAIHLRPIPTGKFNASYFVDIGDTHWVLRVAPPDTATFLFYERHMMRQEPDIHALLLEHTSVPVAPVIACDSSRQFIPRDFLILERLPGRPLSEASVTDVDAVLRRVGHCLAEAHTITARRYGYLGAHAPMEPQETWAQAFHIMWNKLLDDVSATGHYTDQESVRLRRLLDRHLSLFDRPVPSSLLHMDVWAQNILVDAAGSLTGLLDWDRALWGDPEIEFAVLDYCNISRPAFWEGYGKERDTTPEAGLRRVFYLLYELQKYIVIEHGRENNPARAAEYRKQAMALVDQTF